MRRFLVLGWVTALLLLGACSGNSASSDTNKVSVVAAFYPLYETAVRVGGAKVAVTNLTAAGAEPHDLELTTKQVDRIESAAVVLYLGKGFQPAVEKAARRAKGERVDVLTAVNGLLPGSEGEVADPHVWLDPGLMRAIVNRVERALAKAASKDAPTFAANAGTYGAELDQLDRDFSAGLANCQRRVIVTSHAAFGYLARHYGLEQQPIAGLSPEAEPDPKRLAELADLVRAKGVTTIFTETLVSPKIADTLAREAGVKTAVLDPLEGLTKADIAAGKNYLTVMRDSLAKLRAALGCA